jgi:hypothetical protein
VGVVGWRRQPGQRPRRAICRAQWSAQGLQRLARAPEAVAAAGAGLARSEGLQPWATHVQQGAGAATSTRLLIPAAARS